jgi:hypothetical protein
VPYPLQLRCLTLRQCVLTRLLALWRLLVCLRAQVRKVLAPVAQQAQGEAAGAASRRRMGLVSVVSGHMLVRACFGHCIWGVVQVKHAELALRARAVAGTVIACRVTLSATAPHSSGICTCLQTRTRIPDEHCFSRLS